MSGRHGRTAPAGPGNLQVDVEEAADRIARILAGLRSQLLQTPERAADQQDGRARKIRPAWPGEGDGEDEPRGYQRTPGPSHGSRQAIRGPGPVAQLRSQSLMHDHGRQTGQPDRHQQRERRADAAQDVVRCGKSSTLMSTPKYP